MALNYEDLQPGDILLCYGWKDIDGATNWVSVGQAASKSLARITFLPLAREIVFTAATLGYASHDPVAIGASQASCNHAIIVGSTQHEQVANLTEDIDERLAPGDQVTYAKQEDGKVIVRIEPREGDIRVIDITASLQDKSLQFTSGDVLSVPQVGRVFRVRFSKAVYQNIPRICHSTGLGTGYSLANSFFTNSGGRELRVYRFVPPGNTDTDLAARAGAVAARWANTLIGQGGSAYSVPKALLAAFGRSAYGEKAALRVMKYRQHRNTIGGPPSDQLQFRAQQPVGQKEWFCSMFAIACFQAATENDTQVQQYLPLDARYTTPMSLHGFLSRSERWRLVATQLPRS
jgi:hypothetical protein